MLFCGRRATKNQTKYLLVVVLSGSERGNKVILPHEVNVRLGIRKVATQIV